MAVSATKDNFKENTQGTMTLVDFWAPWCAPCKMMEPVLDQLEQQYGKQIKFVKFNVDDSQDIAMEYKVMSIPSLVVFNEGVAKEKVTGVYPKDKLSKYLDKKIEQLEK
ncbi:thioredoxin [Paucilactobacillus hokkaidonensis JCM 18461]|uniref:Thioredoxin n=2 Tax=Paucilactobacillus hokkaidonensis TaxID=1193095 RepID=A0A0A1H176_9LACO|nr:thioredoxin [Paucilactobacillus hokkaidonensis]KRO11161.1 thioredoxin [Paucilactobacillus hokkaidonensis]BAP86476.1 thioredoxin [Paucilactobacillus hokkaidonensis JCM 18461]